MTGEILNEISISLNEGWNLISGISDSIPAEIILDSDGIIIEGTIYQFDGGYSPAEVIEPGRGYWLRTSESGEVSIINFN